MEYNYYIIIAIITTVFGLLGLLTNMNPKKHIKRATIPKFEKTTKPKKDKKQQITIALLSKSKLIPGTIIENNEFEYYYQNKDQSKDFYLWIVNGKFMLELNWMDYDVPMQIEIIYWDDLQRIFKLVTGEELDETTSNDSEKQICYKTNEPCKYNCQGLCKDSC